MRILMHDFTYKGLKLYAEDVPVEKIAKKYKTPVFVYSYKTLVDHFTKLQKAFTSIDTCICYSVKSNSNGAVLKALIEKGAGLDVVSGGELYRGLKAGADASKIVFAGVGKGYDEIELAIRKNILFFTVESKQELEVIARVAKKCGKVAHVALRVNPDVDPKTHKYISTGKKENKFGLNFSAALALYKDIKKMKNIVARGVHMHIGSQITSIQPFLTAIDKMQRFIEKVKSEGINLEYFDIGGGLGIIYKDEKPLTAEQFGNHVIPRLKKLQLKIVLEPGRFISGNAGIMVTQVRYVKESGKYFAIVDAGMNDLIRPSLYSAYHEILPVKKNSRKKVKLDVVGPICESGDFFAQDRMMQLVHPGEYIAVMSAGAYGFTMSSNYNSRPRAAEVLVKGKSMYEIKRRETYKDLLRGESIPDFLA